MSASERTAHPTQKLLEMMKLICNEYCPPNGAVFDPFADSGTMYLVAKMTNRRYVGVEINE